MVELVSPIALNAASWWWRGVIFLSIHNFHLAVSGLDTLNFVLLQNNADCAVLDMLAGGRHRAGEDHVTGAEARGGVHIVAPLQDFVDGFAEFLSEALGLVGKLPREELVAVFGDERLDARVTQQYTDPRPRDAGRQQACRGPHSPHYFGEARNSTYRGR